MIRAIVSDIEFPPVAPEDFRHSTLWDICVPLAIAAVPAGIFMLMGFLGDGLDNERAIPPVWAIVAMVTLQTLGIVALAFVILVRFDAVFKQLSLLTNGHPAVWRKLALVLSIACLLLFDILTNLSAAFAGAEFLRLVAVPTFVAYVLCKRIAFVSLSPGRRKYLVTA